MEVLHFTIILIIISIFFLILKHKKRNNKILPPSPPSLPIIGHFHLLKGRPQHRALKSLSDKYGPLIYLKFGNRPTVVVSSPSLVEECFTKNDIVLANRPQFILTNIFSYGNISVSFSPYGDVWRNLRRISTIHVFSSNSLLQSAMIRSEEIRFSAQKLLENSNSGIWTEVNLTSFFRELVQDMVMKMICGKKWCDSGDGFRELVALASISDYIPMLRWIGYGGVKKKGIEIRKKTDKFLQELLDEGKKSPIVVDKKERKTIIQSYLSLQQADPHYYTDSFIKGLIQVMFTAGTDTSSLTIQWAMAHLLNNPEAMEKARAEIDKHITPGLLIEDSDLPKLPYLRCIISETLRLTPAVPLLLPHFSSEDCTIGGFNVPKGTTVLINAWAIHRDPSLWEDPMKFKPERFEGIEAGCEGFKFLPFGKGRRSCPGNNLAMRFMGLALGTLIQCFEWKRLGDEMVDLDEKKGGLTMSKDKPLRGLYRPRNPTVNLLPHLLVD